MGDQWIIVRNWDRFQHPDVLRSDRPAWVKTYTALLTDNDFLELTDRRRGLLLSLWLLYASARGRVAVNTRRLSSLLAMRVTVADLKALNQAGFIEFSASKPASNYASKVASTEQKREEKKELSSSTSTQDQGNDLPFELQLARAKLLAELGASPNGSLPALERYNLPPAAWYAAAEELHRLPDIRNRGAYVVTLFKTWKEEGRYP